MSLRAAAAVVSLLALGGGAYALARQTSIFAVTTIEVSGGSPQVKAEVRRALAPDLGRSLVALAAGAVTRRLEALPDVVSARLDRDFPHTLHVTVRPERAVLVLRQRRSSWIVSARGRVMRKIADPARSALPRVWLPAGVTVAVGKRLPLYDGSLAAAAVAPIAPRAFQGGIRTVIVSRSELTLKLGTGMQIRLGDLGDLQLKLAIAHRIVRIAAAEGIEPSDAYVDVSVPERPVLGSANSQVESTA